MCVYVCMCVLGGLSCVKDGAKENVQARCGWGLLALVEGVDKDKLSLV